MARWLIVNTFKVGAAEYRKGNTIELTSAQVTALGASNFRAIVNPLNISGSHPASETHDTLGENSGVSNTA